MNLETQNSDEMALEFYETFIASRKSHDLSKKNC